MGTPIHSWSVTRREDKPGRPSRDRGAVCAWALILETHIRPEVNGKSPRWVRELQDWLVGENSRRLLSEELQVEETVCHPPTPPLSPGFLERPQTAFCCAHACTGWLSPSSGQMERLFKIKMCTDTTLSFCVLQRPSFCQNLPRGSNTSQMEGSRHGLGGGGAPLPGEGPRP